MNITEIARAGITELRQRLVIVEYSGIKDQADEGAAIKAEIERRRRDAADEERSPEARPNPNFDPHTDWGDDPMGAWHGRNE